MLSTLPCVGAVRLRQLPSLLPVALVAVVVPLAWVLPQGWMQRVPCALWTFPVLRPRVRMVVVGLVWVVCPMSCPCPCPCLTACWSRPWLARRLGSCHP
jgi:hypothetical protein